MAGVNVKMGVSGVAKFKADINQTKTSLKTLDAQLALNEKQFRLTGDAEEYMRVKAEKLQEKLEAQKAVAETAQSALEKMSTNGVDKSSKAFQDMLRTLVQAKADMIDTETQIKAMGTSADDTTKDTEEMNSELKNIGKGVGFQNLTDGLKKVTDGMANAARTAVRFGKTVARNMMDSTEWADDLLTRSTQYGIDVDTLQRMERVAEFVDTEVDTIISAKDKLSKNRESITELFGISVNGKNADDLFWETGDALMGMTDEMDKAEAAQKIFGRSWRELAPLFTAGREEYERLMESQNVLTEDQVRKLGEADDAIKTVQQQVDQMKHAFWAENAQTVINLLQWLVDNKETVKGALIAIGAGFGALKLAETATELLKISNSLKTLGLLGGAGATASAASSTAGAATAAAAGSGAIGWAGWMGLLGFGAYKGAEALGNYRKANQDKMRGTESYIDAQSGDADLLLANYIRAQQAMSSIDIVSATAEEVEALQKRIEETREQLMANDGGQSALDAYNAWRQENSINYMDWQLPESLQRMTEVAETLAGGQDAQSQSINSLTSAAGDLKGLPAAVAKGVSGIKVVMNGEQVGRLVAPAVSEYIARNVQ